MYQMASPLEHVPIAVRVSGTEAQRVWEERISAPKLEDEVHVWRARLDLGGRELLNAVNALSTVEKLRVERLHFARDKHQYIASHFIIRSILSLYTDTPSADVVFHCGANGKPLLVSGSPHPTIEFSLSHAGGGGLFAVAHSRSVGVDLEFVPERRRLPGMETTIGKYCRNESDIEPPVTERLKLLLRRWTFSEAFFKASGYWIEGITIPETLVRQKLAGEARLQPFSFLGGAWSVSQIEPWPGYLASVVVEGHALRVRYMSWSSGVMNG